MVTRMNPLVGRYFNSTGFGQAMSNLGQAFAPLGAREMYAGARAQSEKANEARIAELYAAAEGDLDRQAVIADLYDPTNSYKALEMGDATTRRGQDVTAATSRGNNLRDNQFDLAGDLATTTLGYDEANLGLTPEMAEAIGMPAVAPQTGAGLGVPAPPMSETEQLAAERQRLLQTGQLTDDDIMAAITSEIPLEQTVGPDGEAVFTRRNEAAGQPAFNNQGGRAASQTFSYRTPEGVEGTALFDPNSGTLADVSTKTPLPPGTRTFKLEGEDAGAMSGATTANVTRGQNVIAEVDYLSERSRAFRELLTQNEGIMGIPGKMRSLAQDVGQAALDLAGVSGSEGMLNSIEDVRALAVRVAQSNGYDPAYAQASALALEMAYATAKMQDPSGEVNVRELERLLGVYDGGIAGNPRVLASLDNLDQQLISRRQFGQQLLAGSGTNMQTPAAPPPGGGGGDLPTYSTPAETANLPSGTRFRDPQGNIRVVP